MFEGLLVKLQIAELIYKYAPVKKGCLFFRNFWVIDDVSFEQLIVEDFEKPDAAENSYSRAYKNHVVRGSEKIARKRGKGSHKAKITAPKTPSEKNLVNFHTDDTYRISFSGTYKTANDEGVIETHFSDELEVEILSKLSKFSGIEQSRQLFLQGEIGCGKSTLLTSVVVKFTQEAFRERASRKKGQLARDICIVSFEGIEFTDRSWTVEQCVEFIYEQIKEELLQQVDVSGENLDELLRNASKAHSFVLILDGLDFLYPQFCQWCFQLENRLSMYHQTLLQVMRDFQQGRFAAFGFICFFVFRNETLEVLKDSSRSIAGFNRVTVNAEDIFSLNSVSGNLVNDVFTTRSNLEGDVCEHTNELFEKHADFSDLQDVAVHGLRHVVDSWSKSFQYIPINQIKSRIYDNPKLFKIFFLTSDIIHYSQIKHGLTNIYLINPHYRAGNGLIDVQTAVRIDTQTFWLKYLMLVHIHANNATASSILALFSGNKASYDSDLIRLILLGFSEVAHGRIIKPNISRFDGHQPITQGIQITKRGKKCIEKGLFFSFEYLACEPDRVYRRGLSSYSAAIVSGIRLS